MMLQACFGLILTCWIGSCLADDDVCHDEDRSPVVAAHCNCEDRKCNDKYDGLGQCIDMKSYTSSAWGLEYLEKTYDLSTPFESGLCSPGTVTPNGPPRDDQCCKCLKRKKCQDLDCKKKFKGQGVCVDLKEDDLTKYDLDFSVAPIQSPKLCKSLVSDKDECCSCFKKKGGLIGPIGWKPVAVLDPKDIFNAKGQKKMRKFIKGVSPLEIPVTYVNSTIN